MNPIGTVISTMTASRIKHTSMQTDTHVFHFLLRKQPERLKLMHPFFYSFVNPIILGGTDALLYICVHSFILHGPGFCIALKISIISSLHKL